MDEMYMEDGKVISIYNGTRIPTGRKSKGRFGLGDLDPANSKLYKLLHEELDVADLDNEELTYGVPRCDDGKFSAKAAWQAARMPRKIRQRMHRELYKRANDKLHGALLGALDSIVELATEPGVEDAVRFQAAKYVLERLQGKTPEVHVHSQEAPWEVVLSNVQRGPRPTKQIDDGNIEEAVVVEDE
jgi:hypothetical protein